MSYEVGTFVCFNLEAYQNDGKSSNGERVFLEKFGNIDKDYLIAKVTKTRYAGYSNNYVSIIAYNPRNGELHTGGYIHEDHLVPLEMGMSEYNSEQIREIKKQLEANESDKVVAVDVAEKTSNDGDVKMSKFESLIEDGKAAAKIGAKVKAGEVITKQAVKMITNLDQCPTAFKILAMYKQANPLIALAVAGILKYLPTEDSRIDFIQECLLNYGTIEFINNIPVNELIDQLISFVPEEAKQYMPEKSAQTKRTQYVSPQTTAQSAE